MTLMPLMMAEALEATLGLRMPSTVADAAFDGG
jgi:hypothetical protein